MWRSASYYPFTDMIRLARGVSLQAVMECEKYTVEGYAIDDVTQYEGFENVESLQYAAALSDAQDELNVFLLNADCTEGQEISLDVRGFEGFALLGHTTLFTPDLTLRNSFEQPQTITPRNVPDTRCEGGVCTAVLPPLSWNVIRFGKEGKR